MEITETQLDRVKGVLVATAVGDALGAGYEGGPHTDTVAAIYGGLIRAGMGYSSILTEWNESLRGYGVENVDEIIELSLKLS